MAAEVLIELALLSGEGRYRDAAVDVMSGLTDALASHPLFFGRLLSVVDTHLGNPLEIALVGDLNSEPLRAMLRQVSSEYIPAKVIAAGPAGTAEPPLLLDRAAGAEGGATAYVCRGFVCSLPVSSPQALRAELGVANPAPEGFQAV
jgi:uncharacterized protein YyaL (SSP411 family)